MLAQICRAIEGSLPPPPSPDSSTPESTKSSCTTPLFPLISILIFVLFFAYLTYPIKVDTELTSGQECVLRMRLRMGRHNSDSLPDTAGSQQGVRDMRPLGLAGQNHPVLATMKNPKSECERGPDDRDLSTLADDSDSNTDNDLQHPTPSNIPSNVALEGCCSTGFFPTAHSG